VSAHATEQRAGDRLVPALRLAQQERGVVSKERPVFILEVRAEPGVDAIRALRWLLKSMRRRFGLRCVSARQENSASADSAAEGAPFTSATRGTKP
jgi:hypothetical protein